jgi:hypothetical protein
MKDRASKVEEIISNKKVKMLGGLFELLYTWLQTNKDIFYIIKLV